jgi:alkylation response protein AidB-like acyl-CoA dehydrogenase
MLDESNSRSKDGDFSMIDMLHHFTSGFKTICAKFVYEGVDELRQACGGAGYLLSSGIGFNWQDVAPYATFEGVNVVMT